MSKLLRVGVIGLGSRWRLRYRPALLHLRDQFAVRAVCDQVRRRAVREARRLGCAAAAGPTTMLEGGDLDALLLCDRQWFGLWPLQVACRAGKPVFCAVPPDQDEAHAEAVLRQVQESRLPVLVETALRQAPAIVRLQELLASQLGPAQAVLGELVLPRRQRRGSEGRTATILDLFGTAGTSLLDCCARLLGGQAVSVVAGRSPCGLLATLLLELDGGRSVQLMRWGGPEARRSLRLRVAAERGSARLEMPGGLHWSDGAGRHTLMPRSEAFPGVAPLLRFHDLVVEGRAPEPNLADLVRALGWLRAAARSVAEGRRIALGDGG